MKKSLIIISITMVIFVIISYIVGGQGLVFKGLNIAKKTALQSALMLFVSFIVIGQIQVLVSKELLDEWLRKFSGIKGIIIGAVAGGLFPGGPYIFYPFILSFKGLPLYILLAAIFGKHLYDFTRISMEVSLISFDVAIIRNILSIPIPIIAGLLAQKFFKDKTIEIY